MAFRVEVREDGSIQIMRPTVNGQNHFTQHDSIEIALLVIKKLLKEDIEEAEKDRFIPQATKEARKAFQIMMEKTPYGQEKK